MEPDAGRPRRGGYDPTEVAPAVDRTAAMPAASPGSVAPGPAYDGPGPAQGHGRYAEPRIQARDLGRTGLITPFARLARCQALSAVGEALFAIGLAGTVFFSTDPNQSRAKVAGYLVLTFAPFVFAAPFIGPLLDRAAGGRRWVIFGAALLRAVLCVLLLRDLDDFFFYPEAFLMLVLTKVNLISKSALVPTTVKNDEELVEANSKLTSLGALAAVVGAALAGVATLVVKLPFLRLGGEHSGTSAILLLGAVAFVATAVQAWNLPPTRVAEHGPDANERAELRSTGIFLAGSATSLSRATMGFLTFLLAFWVKDQDHFLLWLGVLAGSAQIGYFIGSVLAPKVRRILSEERMIQYSLAATAVPALLMFLIRDVGNGLLAAALLAFIVGLGSNVLKQGFDSLVQRDAPDANRGQSFAKFETRFQLWWAIGALVPVVIPIPLWVGILAIAVVTGFALGSYVVGLHEMTEVVAGRRMPRERGPKPWSLEAIRARRAERAATPAASDVAAVDPADRTAGWPAVPPPTPTVARHEPVAGSTVGPYDPTLAEPGGPGLFGQPDAPIPTDLTATPAGGLFDPEAPPPARVAGYRTPAEVAGSEPDEVDIVELPGGGFAAYGAAPASPSTTPSVPPPPTPAPEPVPPPVAEDHGLLPFDTGAETDDWGTREHPASPADDDTTELPVPTPPPLEAF